MYKIILIVVSSVHGSVVFWYSNVKRVVAILYIAGRLLDEAST
jgi:hypothetical protein